MAKYSLASYKVIIRSKDSRLRSMFGDIVIGGRDSYCNSISVSIDASIWSTKGFSTGAWVHTKQLSRVGSVSMALSQMSNDVAKFIKLCNQYYTDNDYDGFTISVVSSDSDIVCTCEDCYPTGIPEQSFGTSSADQTWEFTCGEVTFAG